MYKQIQKLVAGALCALTLTFAGIAPAAAHEMVSGRGGPVLVQGFKGNPFSAQRIAAEFYGLIHGVWMNHETDKLYWILRSRDGSQEIMVAEASVDAQDAIVAQGEITRGGLQGATVSARGYQKGDTFQVELKVTFGGAEVALTQTLEPLEETVQ